MLIDRSHRAWALFSLITLTTATIGWTVSQKYSPAGASGGSFSGLLFGILGTGMMLFAGLLAGRRQLRHLPFGSARFWMKGHLWLGTLCIPFILFHSGFAWGGLLEQLLWYCLAFVALSGFFGLAIQQFLPGLLWKSVPLETLEPQAPALCDRLTLLNDIRLSDLCDRQLNAPSPHLIEPAKRVVVAYRKPASGSETSRKLPLQDVSPPAVRDFFWAMAGFCKETSKNRSREGFKIRVREEFPKLLEQLYSDLRLQDSPAGPAPVGPAASPDPRPKGAPATPSAGGPKVSPLDRARAKASEQTSVSTAAGAGAAAGSAETGAPAASGEASVSASGGPGSAPVKLSPLELMRQKNAAKAAAAAGAGAAAASSSPAVSASPVPAASSAPASSVDGPAKPSPLDLMRNKPAAATPSATAVAGTGAKPPAAARPPAVVPPMPPVKPPGDHSGGAKQPPTEKAPRVLPSPDEKGVLWEFYVSRVRPYLMEHGSGGVVRRSQFTTEMETNRVFHEQRALLPKSLHGGLDELREAVEVRRQLEQQRRLLRWMHWWLMLHVPASILLLVFLAAHVLMALRVVPWQF
ncbi:MAG: hypothetical protein ACKO2P_18280 [Planctomycetota bacterium]